MIKCTKKIEKKTINNFERPMFPKCIGSETIKWLMSSINNYGMLYLFFILICSIFDEGGEK